MFEMNYNSLSLSMVVLVKLNHGHLFSAGLIVVDVVPAHGVRVRHNLL